MTFGFLRDRRGNYTMLTAIAMLPIMGSVAIAIDYSEMNRQKQVTASALDAAGLATARQIVSGATDEQLIAYANEFFKANLGSVDPADTELTVVLPNNQHGGGTLKVSAVLNYKPYFLPSFFTLLGTPPDERDQEISFITDSEIRLKNTLEVALVLDNSGSMDEYGSGSGQKRLALLKTAAKQLVDTLALQANQIKQIEKPVQFSLVPFAASVNVGPENAGASWMDAEGLSPIHHENFDWTKLTDTNKRAEKVGGIWYKRGSDWGEDENGILSRFSLYQDMKHVSDREWVVTGQEYICTRTRNGICRQGYWQETGYYENISTSYASWQGCVEARPYPYNVNDATAQGGTANTGIGFGDPATMFVPMFAPDEPGDRWAVEGQTQDNYNASNNWWNDGTESYSGTTRQKNMAKYFEVRPYGATSPKGSGPNYSCTTTPITPLTDVTTEDGLDTIKTAIDRMTANGNTNVPEGTAWGWRTLTSTPPFAEGRPESEKGNDKVIILLTDGANVYGTQGGSDPASNKSVYSAYGFTGVGYNGTGTTRMFMGTSGAIGRYNYSASNYTAALDEQMVSVCDNAKAAGVLVMTVSLDLSTNVAAENKAIDALKKCSSESRFRKDSADPTKPAKLYWNASGSNLADKFKEIADELSNLRLVG